MRRIPLTSALALIAVLAATPKASAEDLITRHFESPVDAISVSLPREGATAEVSWLLDGRWSGWARMAVENEQDPALRESNLVIFPDGVTDIRLRSSDGIGAVHPLMIPKATLRTLLATNASRIISRKEWGADDSLLYSSKPASGSSAPSGEETGDNGGGTVSAREQECLDAQLNYPDQFKAAKTVTTDASGKRLLWARQYSKKIDLIAVHHTAAAVGGDERSGAERVRAIYAYHAQSRGWGDVGYHYLIDEDGKIYEGRSGGKYVVAGHAYCNNINTLGVALLGNFEVEKPTQAQMKALQWLLADLAETYGVDPAETVAFHGKTLPTILGHRDLLSTDCPGYYAYNVLSQVRRNVASGETGASVKFPAGPKKKSSSSKRSSARPASSGAAVREGVTPLGETTLTGRPGSQILLSVRYANGRTVGRKGADIATVTRGEPTIGLWQDMNGAYERVRDSLTLPQPVPPDGTLAIRLKVQFPQAEGTYTFSLNGIRYTLEAKGRRAPMPRGQTTPAEQLPSQPRHRPLPVKSASSSSRARASSSKAAKRTDGTVRVDDELIRIRLTKAAESATLTLPAGSRVDGETTEGSVFLFRDGDDCVAAAGRERLAAGRVRIEPGGDGVTTLASVTQGPNRYRGVLECRVEGGQFALINELALETYMAGLAEEPDTEPWEKQRAFAIAARTYAAYYMGEKRKFPGRSYDGSDSPAEFQAYGGVAFEEANPRWVKAVKDTSLEVLAVDGEMIRPPYFSASDGRTLSPAQAGWNDFPFAEMFAGKADPWCEGMTRRGHGVGMSGCGAEGQANEGRTAEQILGYYYPGAEIARIAD